MSLMKLTESGEWVDVASMKRWTGDNWEDVYPDGPNADGIIPDRNLGKVMDTIFVKKKLTNGSYTYHSFAENEGLYLSWYNGDGPSTISAPQIPNLNLGIVGATHVEFTLTNTYGSYTPAGFATNAVKFIPSMEIGVRFSTTTKIYCNTIGWNQVRLTAPIDTTASVSREFGIEIADQMWASYKNFSISIYLKDLTFVKLP